jgi:hypothetical protein
MNEPLTIERWVPFFWRAFLTGLVVWMVASVLLAFTHGGAASSFVTIRDIAFPLWFGSLAGMVGALIMRGLLSLTGTRDSSPT